MTATVTVLVTLESMGPCFKCGVHFAADATLKHYRLADRKSFWCPNGHEQHYLGESEAQRLARELEAQRARTQRAEDLATRRGQEADQLRRTKAQIAGKLRAVKQRVMNGVCPCCKRSFVQLARHMRTKHPAWVEEQAKSDAERGLGP